MHKRRMAKLRAKMAENGTDVVVIGPSPHLMWLTGLSPHGDERPVLLVISQTRAAFLMPKVNADSQRPLTALPFYEWSDNEPDAAKLLLSALVDDVAPSHRPLRVSLDETMRADFALMVIEVLPGNIYGALHDTIGALRAVKDASEYATLKSNAILNDGAMRAGFASLRRGVTEKEVANAIVEFYRSNGAEPEFVDICFGPNAAFPHHATSDRKLAVNDVILMDIGCRKAGYASDMTRMGVFGVSSERLDLLMRTVDQAVVAALFTATSGRPACEVDAAARDVINSAGHGKYFPHRTGHGLGIEVHEAPFISAGSQFVLAEGNVFSIEPGVYFEGEFGVRLEEIVIIRDGKAEILSEMSRDLVQVRPQ